MEINNGTTDIPRNPSTWQGNTRQTVHQCHTRGSYSSTWDKLGFWPSPWDIHRLLSLCNALWYFVMSQNTPDQLGDHTNKHFFPPCDLVKNETNELWIILVLSPIMHKLFVSTKISRPRSIWYFLLILHQKVSLLKEKTEQVNERQER